MPPPQNEMQSVSGESIPMSPITSWFLQADRLAICSDGVGEPKRPPCESCHNIGSECVLVECRRGLRNKNARRTIAAEAAAQSALLVGDNIMHLDGPPLSTPAPEPSLSYDNDCLSIRDSEEGYTDENLHMELRNPSDALQILAHTSKSPGRRPESSSSPRNHAQEGDGDTLVARPSVPVPAPSATGMRRGHRSLSRTNRLKGSTTTVLDEYELVQRGLLPPAVLPELLLT